MNQIAARRCRAAQQRRERRPEHERKLFPQRLRPERAQPDDRQNDKIQRRHSGAGKHCARHVPVRVDHFADVTGRLLKRRRGKADQIEPGHDAGDLAKPTLKWHGRDET